MWEKNILEDLETRILECEIIAGEFLTDLRKEFEEGDEKVVKIAELKQLEQEEKIIEEFVQKFRRLARNSRYKR